MKIGDKVSVLDDTITGVITGIHKDVVLVLTTDDFVIQYAKNELVTLNNDLFKEVMLSKDISDIISEKETKKVIKSKRIKPKKRSVSLMEVDLHIHQLITKFKGLNNHEILTIQLETVKKQLDFAIMKKIQRIVFIHGVGEGVLRMELEFLLKRYENVKYYDADYQKYGVGATEVYIFQKKNT